MLSPDQKVCELCGVLFYRRPHTKKYDFGRLRFCSNRCGNLHMNKCRWSGHVSDIRSRFEEKVIPEPNSGCHLWAGAMVPDGYGIFSVATKRNVKAHRVAWSIYRGEIPAGMHVLHWCDNRLCVNPDHLFLGCNDDNVADRVRKGRSWSKLTSAHLAEIAVDARPQHKIAADYGVSQQTISRAKRRVAC